MRSKFLILLVWGMVPLCAMLFLAADYRNFSAETLRQEDYCLKLREHLDRYASRYGQQLVNIQRISNPSQREVWRGSWRRLKAEEQSEINRLGDRHVSRYPQAGQLLAESRMRLGDLERQIDEALRLQDAYIKSGNGLSDLQQQIMYLDAISNQYRTIWTYGIYLDLQERMGQMEDEMNEQRMRQSILEQDAIDSLAKGSELAIDLRESLSNLPDLISQDKRVSYRDDLRGRIEAFDLRARLRELLFGQARASSLSSPAS